MGKKRIKELQKQVKDAKSTLADLEKKANKKILKAQHKVIEDLENMINQETLRRESLLELSEEAWQEAKELMDGLIQKVKNVVKSNK
ncbi:MAG: phosphoenolpyruvate-protein kinase (PTS system EI component) [Oceanicoccus sp.]|jgi:phosphoenolpyruvate-protein kinase (PTS system EI component)